MQIFDLHCGMRGPFNCSMWNLVPHPGIEPRPPALGAQSLSHWTTKEVPIALSLALSLSYQITHSIWYKKHHFLLIFISPCVTTISVRSASNHSNGLFFESFLLLLLSCFSCVRLCATPQTAIHQAPPSLGFSRQEHWSGLPFPSPVHESFLIFY